MIAQFRFSFELFGMSEFHVTDGTEMRLKFLCKPLYLFHRLWLFICIHRVAHWSQTTKLSAGYQDLFSFITFPSSGSVWTLPQYFADSCCNLIIQVDDDLIYNASSIAFLILCMQ